MAEFHDPWAVIQRIRAATASVSDPNDLKIVQEYLQELERKALLLSDGDAGDFVAGHRAGRSALPAISAAGWKR